MARLTTCCVCWKLATGVVATGITCIIFNLIGAAFCGWRLSHLAEEYSHVNRIQNLFTADGLANLFNEDDATSSSEDNGLGKLFGSIFSGATKDANAQVRAAYNRAYAILCVGIALQVISILFNLSLIYAARQKRHRLLLPWLVWYCLFTGLHVIFGLYQLYMIASWKDTGDTWLLMVILLGPAIFYIYLILVVVSYYLILRDAAACGEQPLQPEQQPMQPLPEPLPPSQLGGGQVKQPYAPPAQYAPGGQPYAPPAQYAPGGQPYAPPPQAGQPPPQYSNLSPAQMGGGQVKQ